MSDPIVMIASSIESSIAPIFLLVGIGSLLNVVTARLGRVVDRARVLEKELKTAAAADRPLMLQELGGLDHRMKLQNRAVLFCTTAAVLTCLMVISLFAEYMISFHVGALVAGLFIGTMAFLSVGLISFLQEVTIATRSLRVRTEVLHQTLSDG